MDKNIHSRSETSSEWMEVVAERKVNSAQINILQQETVCDWLVLDG